MYIVLLLFVLIFSDQLSKYIISKNMVEGQTIPLIKDFFHITYVKNRGMVFGAFQGKLPVITIVSIILVCGIIIYVLKNKDKVSILSKIAYIFIISGAIGNIYDRIFRNFVVDLFDFRGIWSYIFNLADVWINIGVILMILEYIFFDSKDNKRKRQEENK